MATQLTDRDSKAILTLIETGRVEEAHNAISRGFDELKQIANNGGWSRVPVDEMWDRYYQLWLKACTAQAAAEK